MSSVRVPPANNFVHEFVQVWPEECYDCSDGSQDPPRIADPARDSAGTVYRAEASLDRSSVATLARRTEVEARTRVGAAGGCPGGQRRQILNSAGIVDRVGTRRALRKGFYVHFQPFEAAPNLKLAAMALTLTSRSIAPGISPRLE
jgi:hypothetical protein